VCGGRSGSSDQDNQTMDGLHHIGVVGGLGDGLASQLFFVFSLVARLFGIAMSGALWSSGAGSLSWLVIALNVIGGVYYIGLCWVIFRTTESISCCGLVRRPPLHVVRTFPSSRLRRGAGVHNTC
jgi:hypothetical protein